MAFKIFFSADEPGFCWIGRKHVQEAATPIISVCLMLLLLNLGCSQDEEPLPPLQRPRVVKPIERPVPEEARTPRISETLKGKPNPMGGERTKTPAVEESILEKPQIETKTRETALPKEAGYYVVKKGESLSSIAGRNDVYADQMKWPILCRFNLEKLGHIQEDEDFVDKELPEGIRLRIITPDEVKDTLEKRANSLWVVNVLSSRMNTEIVPVAVRLVKKGYPAYITRAEVKGKRYMRLRVGFFEDKAAAEMQGKEIIAGLDLPGFWTLRLEREEFEAFGGY